jgi:hypothetical protein
MTHKGKLFIFVSNFNVCVTDVKNDPELTVPGVPSLVSRRKMTLKLNYIYMKVV